MTLPTVGTWKLMQDMTIKGKDTTRTDYTKAQDVPDYLDIYINHVLKEVAQTDTGGLATKTKEMEGFKEMYKNPLYVVLITYTEVVFL
jgi:hypothetical protein